MDSAIYGHLAFLYGEAEAKEYAPRLEQLIKEHAGKASETPRSSSGLPLTSRDALLITYGDQVFEPGLPPLKTLAEFLRAHLLDSVSGVHILPFYPSSSDDGFAVKDFFAVEPALGNWEDVTQIGKSFQLMFDAVFNHVSAVGAWFTKYLKDDPQYKDYFIRVDGTPDLSKVARPRALPLLTTFDSASGPRKIWTTFSGDQVDLNFENPEVLVSVVEALLFYVKRGARFIRLDAIAYLWKEIGTTCIHLPQTHRVIQLMRTVLDTAAPGVMLITETNVPHSDNISYFGDGNNEAQLVYNFALPPLTLHAMLTGNANYLSDWAAALKLPSPAVSFFNFLSSHDGIGLNPARGILPEKEIELLLNNTQANQGFISYKGNPDGTTSPYEMNITYFDAINPPEGKESQSVQVNRFLVAHAIMFALVGMPGIYFHSLFGSRNDYDSAKTTGIPRRINRQKLTRAELERELSDPGSLRSQVFGGMKKLLQARSNHDAFNPSGGQEVVRVADGVFGLLRKSVSGKESALCLHNLRAENATARIEIPGMESSLVLARLGGDSTPPHSPAANMTLRPYEVIWLGLPDVQAGKNSALPGHKLLH